MLVYWVPHIHWRKSVFDSSGEDFDNSDEVVENLIQTNFQDNVVDSNNNLCVSMRIRPKF